GMAELYEIPLTSDVASGLVWDPGQHDWVEGYVDLPTTSRDKVLLVPKAIVRYDPLFDSKDYENRFAIPYLQAKEEKAGSALVRTLKDGRPQGPTKKWIREKYGTGKQLNRRVTFENPGILDRYR